MIIPIGREDHLEIQQKGLQAELKVVSDAKNAKIWRKKNKKFTVVLILDEETDPSGSDILEKQIEEFAGERYLTSNRQRKVGVIVKSTYQSFSETRLVHLCGEVERDILQWAIVLLGDGSVDMASTITALQPAIACLSPNWDPLAIESLVERILGCNGGPEAMGLVLIGKAERNDVHASVREYCGYTLILSRGVSVELCPTCKTSEKYVFTQLSVFCPGCGSGGKVEMPNTTHQAISGSLYSKDWHSSQLLNVQWETVKP